MKRFIPDHKQTHPATGNGRGEGCAVTHRKSGYRRRVIELFAEAGTVLEATLEEALTRTALGFDGTA